MRLLLLLLSALGLLAQTPAADRLGRSTPKSSFLNFLRAAHEGNFRKAALFVQFGPEHSEASRAEITRQLVFILDRGYIGNLDGLSTKAEGAGDDRLPLDRDAAGSIVGHEQSGPVEMVRVNDGNQKVWLISRETVDLVPTLFPEFGFPWIESWMPRALIDTHLFSMPLWVGLGIALALPVSLGLAWSIGKLVLRFSPSAWELGDSASLPFVFFIGLVLHSTVSQSLGLPLLYRVWYTRVLIILFTALSVWLLFGLIGYLDKRAREYLVKQNLNATQTGLQMGRRVLQLLVLLVAVLIALNSLGYDITAALAGLGIGGIALAFAAQKTLENVFGGFSLLSDQSIRVGDTCVFGPTTATVEEIGLRATRFRTIQRSVLYIPNGQLATMNIENLGQRDKILFRHTINVKYGLNTEELDRLLADLGLLLANHERVDAEGRRVHFLKFGAYSLEIELFAFILTNDFPDFLRIQEGLLLNVMRIVTKHGTDFAFPSQTLYVEQGQLALGPEISAPEKKSEDHPS